MRAYSGTYFSDESATKTPTDNRPQVISGPESAPTQADANSIVARVAHVLLQSELDWNAFDTDTYPVFRPLKGLTAAQVQTAIADALA